MGVAISVSGPFLMMPASDRDLGRGCIRHVFRVICYRAKVLGPRFYMQDAYAEIARWISRLVGEQYGRSSICAALARLAAGGFIQKSAARGRGLEIVILSGAKVGREQASFRAAPLNNARAAENQETQKTLPSSEKSSGAVEATTKPEPPAESRPAKAETGGSSGEPPLQPDAIHQSAANLEPPVGIDSDAWRTIVRESRKRRPDATVQEIRDVYEVERDNCERRGGVRWIIGWLITVVPRAVEARLDEWREWHARQARLR